ncbi:MAG: diguanylate cyclase [Sulfuricurvum sp.]|uniref:diguanylate cyclase domain-containing protein n=1 Tax=Sulfuricurvum sp. TaxID=2025608 RepID=UPI002618D640|nr:diguanylate cyclase [Sulfuricurvum sp.]MDD2829956.1 diguanylate cyclase [Sulfuricurvum sp.]
MKSLKSCLLDTFASNKIEYTPYYLIALLSINMLIVAIVSIGLLYNTGLERQKNRLMDLVETQSVMIDIVARQAYMGRNLHLTNMQMRLVAANFIRQINKTFPLYGAIGNTGEFTLGERNNGTIGFIMKQRYFDEKNQVNIPWNSSFAEPMRRALSGKSGVDVMLDYRGASVLAAYKPIPNLGWGLVAKIDLDEIRAPYIKAASYAFLFTALLAVISSIFFWFFVNPLVHEIEDSRQFNRLLISKSPTGLVLCTLDGEIIDANEAFLKIVGRTLQQLMMLNYLDLVDEKYVNKEKEQIKRLIETGTLITCESCYVNSNDQRIPIKLSGELVMMKKIHYIWLSVEDIRDFKKREAELLLSSVVFENSQEAIFITDGKKKIIKVNEAFAHVTGYTQDEALGQSPSFLKSGRHDYLFYEKMFNEIAKSGKWHGEIWNRRKNGSIYPSLQSINAIYDENKKLIRYVSILTDISIQKAYEQQLYDHAHTDTLTGLANRLYFEQKFDQILLRAHYTQQKFALFFIDLNRFKEVNDTMGHDVGDALLQTVANALKEGVRSEDIVARLGGDEFVVILATISNSYEAIQIARHLMEKAHKVVQIKEYSLQPSLSIGISMYPDHGTERSELLKNADEAMYYAKHNTEVHYHIFPLDENS